LLYLFERYYICYIVGIIEKDKFSLLILKKKGFSLLQYENAKYTLFIPIILIKIKLILIKIS